MNVKIDKNPSATMYERFWGAWQCLYFPSLPSRPSEDPWAVNWVLPQCGKIFIKELISLASGDGNEGNDRQNQVTLFRPHVLLVSPWQEAKKPPTTLHWIRPIFIPMYATPYRIIHHLGKTKKFDPKINEMICNREKRLNYIFWIFVPKMIHFWDFSNTVKTK